MQLFYFTLKAGQQIVPDPEGQDLPDEAAARQHALAVAQQLMRHRENDARGWRIEVSDDYLKPLFEVFFAEVDETFDGLPLPLQATIENVIRTSAALNDAMVAMKATLNDVRSTLLLADKLLGSIPGPRL